MQIAYLMHWFSKHQGHWKLVNKVDSQPHPDLLSGSSCGGADQSGFWESSPIDSDECWIRICWLFFFFLMNLEVSVVVALTWRWLKPVGITSQMRWFVGKEYGNLAYENQFHLLLTSYLLFHNMFCEQSDPNSIFLQMMKYWEWYCSVVFLWSVISLLRAGDLP